MLLFAPPYHPQRQTSNNVWNNSTKKWEPRYFAYNIEWSENTRGFMYCQAIRQDTDVDGRDAAKAKNYSYTINGTPISEMTERFDEEGLRARLFFERDNAVFTGVMYQLGVPGEQSDEQR